MGIDSWRVYTNSAMKASTLICTTSESGIEIVGDVGKSTVPVDVNEANWSDHSPFLYIDKATQIVNAVAPTLASNILGLVVDVHLKRKSGVKESEYTTAMNKYHYPGDGSIMDLSVAERQDLLAGYIYEQFRDYAQDEPVDIRLSSGVVPFVHMGMLALIIETAHIHFIQNPFPTLDSANAYLEYAKRADTNAIGTSNNADLRHNAKSSGAITSKSLIEWFLLQYGKGVPVDHRDSNPLKQLHQMGGGFSSGMVEVISQLVDSLGSRPFRLTQGTRVKHTIPLRPSTTTMIAMSPWAGTAVYA